MSAETLPLPSGHVTSDGQALPALHESPGRLLPPGRRMTPIIKPVGDYCNQKCTYCFYVRKDQSTPCLLSNALLERFIAEYLGLFDGDLSFIWHGGEPLLAGLPFFERVISLQRAYTRSGQAISNHIQTNATLITAEWASFFKTHGFKVGVSLDGHRESHDLCRVSRGGGGTFDRVMAGIRHLNDAGVKYGVVKVMTARHLAYIEEDFRFLSDDMKLKQWSINAFVDRTATSGPWACGLSDADFTIALEQYFALWLARNDRALRIREIENFVCGALNRASGHCTFSGTCTRYFCLNHDGRIFPCDSFTNDPDSSFGDLGLDSLQDILVGSKRAAFVAAVNEVPAECRQCEWWKVCHNGCTSQRVGTIAGKYYYCGTRREMFEYARALLSAREADDDATAQGEQP